MALSNTALIEILNNRLVRLALDRETAKLQWDDKAVDAIDADIANTNSRIALIVVEPI
jgi:hypothetical protein